MKSSNNMGHFYSKEQPLGMFNFANKSSINWNALYTSPSQERG